jgi:hypothetical protein
MSQKEEIQRLKRFFLDIKLPEDPIDFGFFRIGDVEKYLDACFTRLERNEGNAWFESNIKKLLELEQYFLDQPKIIKGME